MVPRAVLMKFGLVSIDTARQVNTAHTKTTVNGTSPMSNLSKIAHSTVKRPINKNTTFKNSNFNQRVNTVRGNNVNIARPKVVVNDVKGNHVNAVKALACWVWKPKTKVLDHVSKHNSASITLKKFDYVDAQGQSTNGFTGSRSDLVSKRIKRIDLQLEDAEGVECLPNATIFEQLTLMGKPKRKDTQIPQSSGPIDNVADEAVNEEMDGSLERAATTATSLDTEQDRGNINKTQSKATPNEAGSQGTTSGGGPRCQETMGDTIAQTRFENVSKTSNDTLLARGNTLRSGKDSLKLNELMELCINLQQRVLDLETTKTTQANKITSLKRRVKKLERRNKSGTHGLKRMYRVGSSRKVESSKDDLGEEDASKQGRIFDIDANKDIYLVNVHTDEDMFGVNDLDGDEVIVDNVDVVKTAKETRSVVEEVTTVIEKAKLVSAAEETVNVAATTVSTANTISVSATTTTTTTTVITDDEITLAKALAELKSAKPPTQGITTAATTITADSTRPKAKGIVIHEQEQASTPTVSSQQPSQPT
ncbi:hypothetical protein Tco_0359352 [Tanacetum coccineum]